MELGLEEESLDGRAGLPIVSEPQIVLVSLIGGPMSWQWLVPLDIEDKGGNELKAIGCCDSAQCYLTTPSPLLPFHIRGFSLATCLSEREKGTYFAD